MSDQEEAAPGDEVAQDEAGAAAGAPDAAGATPEEEEDADTVTARARMKLAADRQAECERMIREAAEKEAAEQAAALAAAAAAGEGGAIVVAGAAAPGGDGGAAPAKRRKKSAGAPKSRSELPSSGYHGVVKKSPNCFQAKTLVNGKVLFIGSFNTAESAARAYDACMRDLATSRPQVGDKREREPSYNFPSDAVAEKAAILAEKAVQQEGGTKQCGQCGERMPVRLKVCRRCRSGTGTRSLFKGVRAKSGTAAVPVTAAAEAVASGVDDGSGDGEAAPAPAKGPAKYQAFVWHDRFNEYIGTFHTEEEAALAYDVRYREVFGDAADPAKLNWPTIVEGQAAVDAALRNTAAPRPVIVQKRRKSRPGEAGVEAGAPRPKKPRAKSAGGARVAGAPPQALPEIEMFEGADAAAVAAAAASLAPLCDVPLAPLPPPPPLLEAAPAQQPTSIFAAFGID